jgi:hypothetical protein
MTNTPTEPVVEMLINGVWVDITADCRLNSASSGGGITVTRGRPNEGNAAEPTQLDFTLNNREGKYSDENPNGPYYGYLGRNQPVRVGIGRREDFFTRAAASGTWGRLPDRVTPELKTVQGELWNLTGAAGNFALTGTEATIQSGVDTRMATFGTYGDVEVTTRAKVSTHDTAFGIILRAQRSGSVKWYGAYIAPQVSPANDRLRLNKDVGVSSWANGTDFIPAIVPGTYYLFKAQFSGQRMRVKVWKEGDPEPTAWFARYDNFTDDVEEGPTYGEVGLFVTGGTGIGTFSEIKVNQWRAHAEIAVLPPRWDLSRKDRWVPIQARGITRRLGQGRKALNSAVTLHLNRYTSLSSMWFPLEGDTGESASNAITGGLSGTIQSLTFQAADTVGLTALPGVSGFAHFGDDTSKLIVSASNYTNTGKWTLLWFLKFPGSLPADAIMTTIQTTGTARTWRITATTGTGVRVEALAADGTVLASGLSALYFLPDHPVGCWLAATLYLFQSGGNVVWAWNFHHPGGTSFFTVNGSFAGSVGLFRTATFSGSPNMTAAGGLDITQVFHYAGDLPFVSTEFARAAAAYANEEAMTRFLRLTSDAGLPATNMGSVVGTEPMGPQVPAKLMELLEDCAQVEDGILMEERDDFSLALMTRLAHYNQPKLLLDIDAGHLSSPLEPIKDDQGTRNDVTVSRPGGGFAVSVQTSGPLNVNPPEDDPDGVGVYDEAPEINFASDLQLQAAADWRRSRGTLNESRYPSIRADLAAEVYQSSPSLSARVLAIDSGRMLRLDNPEVSPDPADQIVQSYTEKLDQYEHDLTSVAAPGRLYTGAVVSSSTQIYRNALRVQPSGIRVQTAFISGTHTALLCERFDSTYGLWKTTAADPRVTGFEIMAAGVRLMVVSIAGGSDPQTITVVQQPTNGVIKTIPVGSRITLADPPRVKW